MPLKYYLVVGESKVKGCVRFGRTTIIFFHRQQYESIRARFTVSPGPPASNLYYHLSSVVTPRWKPLLGIGKKTGCGSLSPPRQVRRARTLEWKIVWKTFSFFYSKNFIMFQQSLSRFDSIAVMVLIETFVRTPHLLIIVLPSFVVSGSFLCTEESHSQLFA